jgi:drug/metabolite transporter (DMT)-like permease
MTSPDNGNGNGAGARFKLTDLAMLFVVLCWGLNMSVIKIGLRGLSPHAFNAVRLVLASAACLIILLVIPSGFRLARGDFWRSVGLGVLGISLYQVFFIQAINIMSASTAAIVMGTSPIFIALLSTAIGQERIHWAGWLGIGVSFAGFMLVVSGENGGAVMSWENMKGAVLILLANACWAGYTVFARPVLKRNSPMKVSTLATITGTLLYLPFTIPELSRLDLRGITPAGWGAIAYSGLVAITLCFVLWYVSLKAVGSSKTGIYSNLTPIIAAVTAAVVLGEKLTGLQVAGAVITLSGVYLTRSGYRFFVKKDGNA